MQKAGFHTVLIFNQAGESKEATVRMSAHSLGNEITASAAFMTRANGIELVTKIIGSGKGYGFLDIKPFDPLWISKDILWSGVVDMFVLLVLVVLTGSGFMTFGLIINLGHNYIVHGRFYFAETVREASLLILNGGSENPNPPKLDKITFPTRILDEKDFVHEWTCGGLKGHENCPICIEEFQVGNQVRELPCRHIFHAAWSELLM
jgi:hypothetical protein